MDQLGGILLQYVHPKRNQLFPHIYSDFRTLAECVSPQVIANGLATLFRADDTPTFAQLVVDLFKHSDAFQRAGLLTVLLRYLGQKSQSVLADAGLVGVAGAMNFLPDRMMEISTEAVFLITTEAEQRHRSGAISDVSGFYARHPGVLKHLGAHTLSLIMVSIANSV